MSLSSELSAYVDRSKRLIDESPQMDEQNTKRKLIEPLLDVLGWKMLSSDVELEYSVPMGSGTKKVDYALQLEGTPVVFVEAKGCDTSLTDSHENQLRSYMRQVGVEWGLLSNGRTFELFRRDDSTHRPNEIALAAFSLDDISNQTRPLTVLTRDSIRSGESEQIAARIESVQAAINTLRAEKETVAEDVTQVVTNVVGEAVSQQVEDEAKRFVDALVASLEGQTQPSEPVSNPSTGSSSIPDGEYVIEVLKNGSTVAEVSGENQSTSMAALVEYLIAEEGLLEAIEVPYVPGTGRGSSVLLNDEPVHTNGNEMRGYELMSNGYYVFTALSAKDKIRYVSELPAHVGLNCAFRGAWEE